MTRGTKNSRKLRSQLLLSVSLLTTGLVSYGRPALADCILDAANTYVCSGDIPSLSHMTSFNYDRAITVVADETANFSGGFKYDMFVSGADISIDVQEGAQFHRGLRADTGLGNSPSVTATGVDIVFNGDIDQTLPRAPGIYSDFGEGKYGHGIEVRAKYGDARVVTGSGDITLIKPTRNKYGSQTNSGIEINASYEGAGNVVVETGAGNISGGTSGINIQALHDVTVTTGAGSISGTEHGILVKQRTYGKNMSQPHRHATGEQNTVEINTGAGDISGEKYGIGVVTQSANIEITTGSGAIGLSGNDDNPRGTFAGIMAVSNKYNSESEAGSIEITIGEGTVNGFFGVLAIGQDTNVTVSGDVIANDSAAGIFVSSNNKYNSPLNAAVAVPKAVVGNHVIKIEAGGSVNAENGYFGIASKYGNSDITIAGEVIGGEGGAIRTNVSASSGSDQSKYIGTTRVELQSGFAITGNVIAGGQRQDDVLALGGSENLSFDISKIGTTPPEDVTIGMVLENNEQFYNFDLFEKVGSGTASINGLNDKIDNFTVREGTLQLVDVRADAMAVDLQGGQLTGMGRIGGLVAREGTTVSPGVDNGISTIEIAGSLALESGSRLAIDVNAQGDSDLLEVGGSATIGNNVNLAITGEAGDYSTEDLEWTVISTADGVTGTFDEVTDTLMDVEFVDVYNGETVVLQATVAAEPPVLVSDTLSAKSNGAASTASAGFAGLSFASNLNSVRQRANAGDAGQTVTTSSLSYSDIDHFSSKGDAAWNTSNMTAFFGTFTEQTEVETTGTNLGYDTQSTGFLGGLSYAGTVNDITAYQLNLGLGYSGTYTETRQGFADSTSVHAGIGGALTSGPLNLKGALGYSVADVDLSRQVGTATATAQTDARTFSGVIQASYDVASKAGLPEGARLAPMVRIRGYSTTADGYTESGAGILNLNVDEVSSDSVYAGVGFEYSGSYEFNGATLRPSLDVIYDTKISGGDTNAVATITGVSGAFDTAVNTGPDHVFSVDAGVAFDINENVEGFVNYGTTFGDDLQSHRGMVGLTIKF